MKKYFILLAVIISLQQNLNAQSVGIGTSAPNSSAILDISSTNKGMLLPRMSTTQRNAIVSPAVGLSIFNIDDQCTDIYDGNNWIKNCGFKQQTDSVTYPGNTWKPTIDFGGQERWEAVGFSIGDKGYIGTGVSTLGTMNDFWEYNSVTNAWSQKANVGGPVRSQAVGFSIGGKGYIGTGASPTGGLNDFWEYNPSTNTWTQKANFAGAARAYAVGFSIGNKGFIGTGYIGGGGNGTTNDFWEYNPSTNTWSPKADFGGAARMSSVAFSIADKGYIGHGDGFIDFWEYDTTTNIWTQKANFSSPLSRTAATGFSIGNKGYVGTGLGSQYLFDLWEFDPVLNNWIQKASNFSGPGRNEAVGFSIGNKGYIGTGRGQPGYLKDFYIFRPQPSTYATYSSSPITPPTEVNITDGMWTKTVLNDIISVGGVITISAEGKVGIGISNPTHKLHVNGNILATGTISPSDIRYKKNIHSIPNAVDKIMQLNGVFYDLRSSEFPQMHFDSKEQVGLIAQNVEQVLPNVVYTGKDGYKGVDYAKLVPLLIEAMKEQQKQIDEQRKMIDELLKK